MFEELVKQLIDQHPGDVHKAFVSKIELPMLEVVLKSTHWNQTKTAKLLGINRGTLRKKMKRHGLL